MGASNGAQHLGASNGARHLLLEVLEVYVVANNGRARGMARS